jgi:hypothetical protein
MKGFVLMTSFNNATGAFEMPMECAPEAGPYPDGAYQTKVLVNDEVVALVNWSVGGPVQGEKSPVPAKESATDLKGEWRILGSEHLGRPRPQLPDKEGNPDAIGHRSTGRDALSPFGFDDQINDSRYLYEFQPSWKIIVWLIDLFLVPSV